MPAPSGHWSSSLLCLHALALEGRLLTDVYWMSQAATEQSASLENNELQPVIAPVQLVCEQNELLGLYMRL